MNAQLIIRRTLLAALVLFTLVMAAGCASETKPEAPQVKAAFWPPYPDEPHLQFLVSYRSSNDIAAKKSKLDELVLGKENEDSLDLNKPYGVEMYDGKIYVCDQRRNNVTVLDLRNHVTMVLGQSGGVTLQQPTDIAISPDGMKYVSDIDTGQIYIFDKSEKFAGQFGHKELKPAGLALYQNLLYVSDFKEKRIEVYDRTTGQLVRTIGGPGLNPGQFLQPLGIAVDDKGFVYVADFMACKLQKFDPQGKLVTSFSDMSASAGGLIRPKHMDVDRDGIIYVVDAAFNNVQLFDQVGHVYTYFGSTGTHPGSMLLPVGICVHEGDLDLFAKYVHPAFEAQRLVIVTNQFGDNKVSVYALGHLKAGKTVADISNTSGLVPRGVDDKAKVTGAGAPLPPNAVVPAPATQPAATNAPVVQP
jgi:sugar lactone lactonase YvrE